MLWQLVASLGLRNLRFSGFVHSAATFSRSQQLPLRSNLYQLQEREDQKKIQVITVITRQEFYVTRKWGIFVWDPAARGHDLPSHSSVLSLAPL